MNRQRTCILLLMLCSLLLAAPAAHAQTGFAYTGTLPNKPTGTYDFQFRLYSASSGGAQVGSTLSLSSVPVSSGSYSVSLDFGASSFGGSPLYLALSYRVHGTTTYTNLSGRVLQTTRFSILSNNTLSIGGYPVSSTAPASGQALVWNGSAWTPGSGSGGGTTYSAGAGLALTGNIFSIASGGVIASMLASNSVTTAAIADGAVTASKLSWPISASVSSSSALLGLTNTGSGDGVEGTSSSGNGVDGISNSGIGVYGSSSSAPGVYGYSSSGIGGSFTSNSGSAGVWGYNNNTGDGVYGSSSGTGVHGQSDSSYGVYGQSYSSGDGVFGSSRSGSGVYGYSYSGIGVYGFSGTSYAGYFFGDLQVTGTITAGGKDFKIDHPLDPANKYLLHACVESDQMVNLYRGNVLLDTAGQAVVTVPDWFEALNTDFSYQLTCVGGFAPVYIAQELHNRQFRIAGGQLGMKVCWQITGERQDAYAKAHPLQVEQEKPQKEQGKYLHPVEAGVDETLGLDYERTHRHK